MQLSARSTVAKGLAPLRSSRKAVVVRAEQQKVRTTRRVHPAPDQRAGRRS